MTLEEKIVFKEIYSSETAGMELCEGSGMALIAANEETLKSMYEQMNLGFNHIDSQGNPCSSISPGAVLSKRYPPYKPDFESEIIMGIFAGEKPIQGYSILVDQVVNTEYQIVVYAKLKGPEFAEFGAMGLSAASYPVTIISFPQLYKPVRLEFTNITT